MNAGGCKDDPPPPLAFASYPYLERAIREIGGELQATQAPNHARGVLWLGPCNCKLEIKTAGDLSPMADGVHAGIDDLSFVLEACPAGRGVDHVIRVLDELFGERDRTELRALLAAPPLLQDLGTLTVKRRIGAVRVEAVWSSDIWLEVPATPRNLGWLDHDLAITIVPTYGEYPNDEVVPSAKQVTGMTPEPCEDGTRRPWELAGATP
jgi:hypothetical protein